MGLNYSYSFITQSDHIDSLLQHLAGYLAIPDALRLQNSLPWKPAIEQAAIWDNGYEVRYSQGINGIQLREHESSNYLCLAFLFPIDHELEEFQRNIFRESYRKEFKARIGCIYTSLFVGSEFALLKARAATTEMSLLFNASSSIKKVMIEISESSSSKALFFDKEEQYNWNLLYPEARLSPKPWIDNFWSPHLEVFYTDMYCMEALHHSRIYEY